MDIKTLMNRERLRDEAQRKTSVDKHEAKFGVEGGYGSVAERRHQVAPGESMKRLSAAFRGKVKRSYMPDIMSSVELFAIAQRKRAAAARVASAREAARVASNNQPLVVTLPPVKKTFWEWFFGL